MAPDRTAARRDVAQNRRAFHDYLVDDRLEAGLELTGTEVKSLRAGRVNLRDGFVRVAGGQAWLENVHISPYTQGTWTNHDPMRRRRLLLHEREIARLQGQVRQQGYTLIPLRMYFRGNWAKVELGLARGKKLYDKRQALAEREAKRQIERALKR